MLLILNALAVNSLDTPLSHTFSTADRHQIYEQDILYVIMQQRKTELNVAASR